MDNLKTDRKTEKARNYLLKLLAKVQKDSKDEAGLKSTMTKFVNMCAQATGPEYAGYYKNLVQKATGIEVETELKAEDTDAAEGQ